MPSKSATRHHRCQKAFKKLNEPGHYHRGAGPSLSFGSDCLRTAPPGGEHQDRWDGKTYSRVFVLDERAVELIVINDPLSRNRYGPTIELRTK